MRQQVTTSLLPALRGEGPAPSLSRGGAQRRMRGGAARLKLATPLTRTLSPHDPSKDDRLSTGRAARGGASVESPTFRLFPRASVQINESTLICSSSDVPVAPRTECLGPAACQARDIPVFDRTGNFHSLMGRIHSLFGRVGNSPGIASNYWSFGDGFPRIGRKSGNSLRFSLLAGIWPTPEAPAPSGPGSLLWPTLRPLHAVRTPTVPTIRIETSESLRDRVARSAG